MSRSPILVRQPHVKEIILLVDESAISGDTNAGLLEGKYEGTIAKNGTGDYTFTYSGISRRTLVVAGVVPYTANLSPQIVSATSSAVNVVFTNNADAAADTDFTLILKAFGKKEQF